MEDRRTGALYLELVDGPPEGYGTGRAVEVGDRLGVTRTTWWSNQHPDRTDVPRRLPEFATLGVHELGPGFTPPAPVPGVTGLHLAETPRPGQGSLGGDATDGLLVVLISPKHPEGAQALRDWGDFVHLRHIAEAGVPGYRMITPYEVVGGGEPRYLHLYELHGDDPEAIYRSMTPLVQERLGPPGTPAYDDWAWHPELMIDYVNTFALVGERVPVSR
ncbi:MAG TPA: hypothetical protein VD926_03410 [Acidimicrobiales bacterium]|nr:hypothetical protein [Acidimicrobiales bacterium]